MKITLVQAEESSCFWQPKDGYLTCTGALSCFQKMNSTLAFFLTTRFPISDPKLNVTFATLQFLITKFKKHCLTGNYNLKQFFWGSPGLLLAGNLSGMSERGGKRFQRNRRQGRVPPFLLSSPAPEPDLHPSPWEGGGNHLLRTTPFLFLGHFLSSASLTLVLNSLILPTFCLNGKSPFPSKGMSEFWQILPKEISEKQTWGLSIGYLQLGNTSVSARQRGWSCGFSLSFRVPFGLILVIPSIPAPLSPEKASEGGDLSPLEYEMQVATSLYPEEAGAELGIQASGKGRLHPPLVLKSSSKGRTPSDFVISLP